MSDPERVDPYSAIAVLDDDHFELSGSNALVPLIFTPQPAYVLRFITEQEREFTTIDIVDSPGFEELCEGVYPRGRFTSVFSQLRFTLDALGTTILQHKSSVGVTKIYERNPNYLITHGQVQPQLKH